MNDAIWEKNGKRITGSWIYRRSSNRFWISLDSKDRVTGRYRTFYINGEHPEFNGWKLVKKDDNNER